MSQRHTNIPPPEFFAGDVAADVDGAHETAVLAQRRGQGALPAATDSPAMSRLSVVCPGVLRRWRGPDVGGPAPWGAHDAGFALQLATVRWLAMFLADPLTVPGSRSWPAAASPGYRPVSAGSWAGRWLPASR
jgi:hypothetical protein